MTTTGSGQTTHFASPERDSPDSLRHQIDAFGENPVLAWLDAVPMPVVVLNRHRQILFCNEHFRQLSFKQKNEDVLGLRPGEALDCVNAELEQAGCGCSFYCGVCGAAKAIVKSLDGKAECQECRLVRRIDDAEVPLDLQVFSRPIEFRGQSLVILFAMDVSHELRLRYLNRTFYHGLINSVGGMATLSELIEADPEDTALFPLLIDSARRTLGEVLYHRDLFAAESGKLKTDPESFAAGPYLKDLIATVCRLRNTQPSLVELDMEDGKISLHCDKRLLGHVLRNMLVNAMEASNGNPGTIRLSCRSTGKATILSLENPGVIPPDIQKEMFKRYVSTKSRDRGLGTYVIKLLTENYLDGTVCFSSDNGITRFEIALPDRAGGTA